MYLNKNAISPLIASILIIVVVVAVIGVILLWSKNFTNESFSSASSFSQDKTVSDFVWQDDITGKNLFIKNTHTSVSKTIIGYKINSSLDYAYLNKYHYLDESFLLSKNSIAQLTLGCVPEKNFSIELLTDSNEYISFPVTSKFYDPSECTFSFSITSPLENSINALNSSISFTSEILNSSGTPSCTWISSIDGTFSTSCDVTYSSLSSGSHDINLVVEDSGDILTQSTSIIVKDSLESIISTPSNSSNHLFSDTISFSGTADNNFGAYTCSWTSSLDGSLSSDCSFSSSLSPGTHTITLQVTDSLETASSNISIEVYALLVASVSLPANNSTKSLGSSISFSSSISGGDGSYSCSWTDNGSPLSSSCSFSHTYPQGSWSAYSDMPKGVDYVDCVGVDNKLYCFGGADLSYDSSKTTQIYNALTNTWSLGANMPDYREELACTHYNGIIYCIGGTESPNFDYLKSNYAYNISSNTWSTKTSMPTERSQHDCAALDGKIYCFGGNKNMGGVADLLEIYNISTNSWTTGATAPSGKLSARCEGINNKIYCIGGTTTTLIYDVLSDSWTTGATMPISKSYPDSGVYGTKIYLGGGSSAALLVYDTVSNSWTTLSNLPNSNRTNLGCGVANNTFFCAGGDSSIDRDDYLANLHGYSIGQTGTHEIELNVSDGYGQTASNTININVQ